MNEAAAHRLGRRSFNAFDLYQTRPVRRKERSHIPQNVTGNNDNTIH